jgi:hypothetical protein
MICLLPSRLDAEGVSRSSRHVRRGCGGRFGDAHDSFVQTNGADADAKSCGPGLPTLRPSCADTIHAAMGARKPGPQGEHDISVKTIAQGMPDEWLNLWFLPRAFFMHGGHGLRPAPGIPCALSSEEGDVRCKARARIAPRECGRTSRGIDVIASEAKQSRISPRRQSGLLRRNRASQ